MNRIPNTNDIISRLSNATPPLLQRKHFSVQELEDMPTAQLKHFQLYPDKPEPVDVDLLADEISALLTEITFRGIYISMKCDYYLEGSRKIGSAKKEKGHKQQLFEKRRALANCMRKKTPCLDRWLKKHLKNMFN